MKRRAVVAAIAATMVIGNSAHAAQPGDVFCPPRNRDDCVVVVAIPRYGTVAVQVEYLDRLACLNAGACVLYEDGSIGLPVSR